MKAIIHPITGRKKAFESNYATPEDFELGPGEDSTVERLLTEPGWAPYCIDAEGRRVCFVRMPASVDLHTVPFALVTEYYEATHLMAVSFDDVAMLAAPLPDPKVILVFSMGRCGTTLLSHALNGPESVAGLSEPPIFEHRPLRALAGDPALPQLIRDCCRLLFAMRTKRKADTLAVKFRSQALYVGEVFWKALPTARYIFMYRDAVSWGNSFLQFVTDMGVSDVTNIQTRDFHWMMVSGDKPLSEFGRFIDLDKPVQDAGAIFAPGWTIHMEAYEKLRALGVPFIALRYNELMADREGELARLFDHCGVPRDGIPAALKAFDRDSQEGTKIARKANPRRLTPEERATFIGRLAVVPEFADPDTILRDVYSN